MSRTVSSGPSVNSKGELLFFFLWNISKWDVEDKPRKGSKEWRDYWFREEDGRRGDERWREKVIVARAYFLLHNIYYDIVRWKRLCMLGWWNLSYFFTLILSNSQPPSPPILYFYVHSFLIHKLITIQNCFQVGNYYFLDLTPIGHCHREGKFSLLLRENTNHRCLIFLAMG